MKKSFGAWKDPEYLYREFVVKKRSTSDIADEHGVFPNTIRRELIRQGIQPRSKSDAQKINLNRNGHPMEGRSRTEEEKEKISLGLHHFWHADSDKKNKRAENLRKKLAKLAKDQWDGLSEKERNEIIKRMHLASANSSGKGSKSENAVAALLEEQGFNVVQRSKEYTPGGQFEIDIALPDHKMAIEWDGATHFLPIYGEERLAVVQEKDARKDDLLISAGWTVIRCRDMSSGYSRAFCTRTVDAILMILKNGPHNTLHIVEAK